MSPFWDLERFGDNIALFDTEAREITYASLAALADEAVAHLPAQSLFALEFSHTVDAVAVYLGSLRRGHVALLLDKGLAEPFKQRLLQRYLVRHVFDGKSWRPGASGHGQPLLPHRDLRLLMSTSGSTGSPKLVRLSGDNLAANAASIAAFMELSSADRGITSLPLHYSYGLSVLNSHLAAGGGTVLNEDAVITQRFWERFKEIGVTTLAGVPPTWRMLRRLGFERMALPSLRLMSAAGGRLDPAETLWLAEFAAASGRAFYSMYGQTEATARIAFLPPELARAKLGCIGQPIPGGAIRLLSPEGVEIEGVDIEGELAFRGPNVMFGYAETPEDLQRGRDISELLTGDLARRDLDGHFWITGRRSRIVKLLGLRFNLDDVEAQVRAWGWAGAAVGEDDHLRIAVVAEPSRAADLRQRLAVHYRVHHSVISVVCLPQLPRTAAGKVKYAELLDRITSAASRS